jgi:hypothetical protein
VVVGSMSDAGADASADSGTDSGSIVDVRADGSVVTDAQAKDSASASWAIAAACAVAGTCARRVRRRRIARQLPANREAIA